MSSSFQTTGIKRRLDFAQVRAPREAGSEGADWAIRAAKKPRTSQPVATGSGSQATRQLNLIWPTSQAAHGPQHASNVRDTQFLARSNEHLPPPPIGGQCAFSIHDAPAPESPRPVPRHHHAPIAYTAAHPSRFPPQNHIAQPRVMPRAVPVGMRVRQQPGLADPSRTTQRFVPASQHHAPVIMTSEARHTFAVAHGDRQPLHNRQRPVLPNGADIEILSHGPSPTDPTVTVTKGVMRPFQGIVKVEDGASVAIEKYTLNGRSWAKTGTTTLASADGASEECLLAIAHDQHALFSFQTPSRVLAPPPNEVNLRAATPPQAVRDDPMRIANILQTNG